MPIEHCFGLWKGRWRFLRGTLAVAPKRSGVSFTNEAGEVVRAEDMEPAAESHRRFHSRCCVVILMGAVLHNFTLAKRDLACQTWKLDPHYDIEPDDPEAPMGPNNLLLARRARQAIGDYINGYHVHYAQSNY